MIAFGNELVPMLAKGPREHPGRLGELSEEPEPRVASRYADLCVVSVVVSVVVSIRTRKIFAEVRKMFSNARHAEQDVRELRAS